MNLAKRPDPALLAKFRLEKGSVYRVKGKSRKALCQNVHGLIYATVDGVRIAAHDIAWALVFGNWPMWPLAHVDGQDWNLAIANLTPMRGRVLRCRVTERDGKFYHSLSGVDSYRSKKLAKEGWHLRAITAYLADREFCLDQEALARSGALQEMPRERVPKVREAVDLSALNLPPIDPYLVEGKVTSRPKVALNARAHWRPELNSWLVVNAPAGVWDDYRIRCAAALRGLFPTEAG